MSNARRVSARRSRRGHMTLEQAIERASRQAARGPSIHSHVSYTIYRRDGTVEESPWIHNLTTDAAAGYTGRRQWEAAAMGNGLAAAFATATGNATSTSASSLTNTGAAFPTTGLGLSGCIVAAGPNSSGAGAVAWGYVTSNTATVLTIDQWYNPASATGAAVGTPPNGTCSYQILFVQGPAAFLALSSNVGAPATSDTTLNSEFSGSGLTRAIGSWSHALNATTFTLTHTFTATGSATVAEEAEFSSAVINLGVMPFESSESPNAVLAAGDTVAQTITITIN